MTLLATATARNRSNPKHQILSSLARTAVNFLFSQFNFTAVAVRIGLAEDS